MEGVREEELEALVRCRAPGAGKGEVTQIVEEVGEEGLRVMVVSDAAVRALAAMAVGQDLPERWAKAARTTRGVARRTIDC